MKLTRFDTEKNFMLQCQDVLGLEEIWSTLESRMLPRKLLKIHEMHLLCRHDICKLSTR